MQQIEEEKKASEMLHPSEFKKHEYVDANFPFARADGEYACPYWVKCFLREKYNLRKVREIITEYHGRDFHDAYVDRLFLPDIDLEAYTDYEVYLLKQEWKDAKRTLKFYPDIGEPFEVEAGNQVVVGDLKRLILNKAQRPFFLKYNVENTQPISQLLDKHSHHNTQLRIYFNFDEFELDIINHVDPSSILRVAHVKNSTTLEKLILTAKDHNTKDTNYSVVTVGSDGKLALLPKPTMTIKQAKINRFTELRYVNLVIKLLFTHDDSEGSVFIDQLETNCSTLERLIQKKYGDKMPNNTSIEMKRQNG